MLTNNNPVLSTSTKEGYPYIQLTEQKIDTWIPISFLDADPEIMTLQFPEFNLKLNYRRQKYQWKKNALTIIMRDSNNFLYKNPPVTNGFISFKTKEGVKNNVILSKGFSKGLIGILGIYIPEKSIYCEGTDGFLNKAFISNEIYTYSKLNTFENGKIIGYKPEVYLIEPHSYELISVSEKNIFESLNYLKNNYPQVFASQENLFNLISYKLLKEKVYANN